MLEIVGGGFARSFPHLENLMKQLIDIGADSRNPSINPRTRFV
ncbi:MAG: hypothetical protein QW816_06390 [Desulfurococcaceae archaeon]